MFCDLTVFPRRGVRVHSPPDAVRCLVNGAHVARILEGKSGSEPGNPSTDDNNPWLPSGRKPCRFAKHDSRGNSAGKFEEITTARSSASPLILNGTNGFSESLCVFEIPV